MSEAARVQAYLRAAVAGDAPLVAGGFQLKLRGDNPSAHANYAMPVAPVGLDLDALRAAFSAHARTLRLEWVGEFAPTLEAEARAAGLALELRTPVMTCARADRRDPPAVPGLDVVDVAPDAPDALLRELIAVQEEGFGVADVDVSDADVAFLRGAVAGAALGRLEGTPAGAGALNLVRDAMAEVVGVATRPDFRRRGVATAVVGALARQGFARGAELLLLTPQDAGAERLYARAGFAPRLTMLHYCAPAA